MNKMLLLYLVSILLGILTGLIGSVFQLAIAGLDRGLVYILDFVRQQNLPAALVSALLSMIMVAVAYILVRRFAPEAAGSGVQEIEGTLLHQRPIFWKRLLPVKFFASILTISSKMVVGREGPTIQIGGNLGEMLGDKFRFSRDIADVLIAAGSAAGLATAFNAPLAGVIFILEEMRNAFDYSFTKFKMVAICCVMATITLHCIVGSQAAISMTIYALPNLQSLWLFFLFGIIVGLAGLLFNTGLMGFLNIMDKQTPTVRWLYVLSMASITGYLAWVYPQVVGGGYEIIHHSLDYSYSFVVLSVLFCIRFILTLACYSTGVPGGIFAPLLALGTVLGMAAFQLLDWLIADPSLQPGMLAVAGMGALFSASVRAPLTGVVLIVEMTQNYSLILPLMVSCLTSTTIMQLGRNEPLYTQLLRRTMRLQQKTLEK